MEAAYIPMAIRLSSKVTLGARNLAAKARFNDIKICHGPFCDIDDRFTSPSPSTIFQHPLSGISNGNALRGIEAQQGRRLPQECAAVLQCDAYLPAFRRRPVAPVHQ